MNDMNDDESKVEEEEEKDWFDKITGPWWGKFLVGMFLVWVTYGMYGDFTALESGAVDSIRLNKVESTLYDIGGKWGALGFSMLCTAAMFGWMIWQLTLGSEPKSPDS